LRKTPCPARFLCFPRLLAGIWAPPQVDSVLREHMPTFSGFRRKPGRVGGSLAIWLHHHAPVERLVGSAESVRARGGTTPADTLLRDCHTGGGGTSQCDLRTCELRDGSPGKQDSVSFEGKR